MRVRDDWGGWNCDMEHKKEKMDGIVSNTNTIMNLVPDGPSMKIKEIVMYGAVVSQMFDTEGVSHLSITNVTHTLVEDKDSSGDISPGGQTYDSLMYKFADDELQWKSSKDLKAQEPFFSSGQYMDDLSGNTPKNVFKSMMGTFMETMEKLEKRDGLTEENVRKAHFSGINRLAVPIFGMDYLGLKSLFAELKGDTSKEGVEKSNIFQELLGAAGSSPAAYLVIELIKEGKVNDRDGARMLSSIPYHIRFPREKMVEKMGELLDLYKTLGDD